MPGDACKQRPLSRSRLVAAVGEEGSRSSVAEHTLCMQKILRLKAPMPPAERKEETRGGKDPSPPETAGKGCCLEWGAPEPDSLALPC